MGHIPNLLTFSFVTLIIAVAFAFLLVFRKTIVLSTQKRKYLPLILLVLILTIVTILSANGIFLATLKNTPPPFFPMVFSIVALTTYFAFFYKPLQNFEESKMKFVVAIQTFRFPLEVIFVWLLANNLMPIQMTFEGRNFDVLVGITAPFIAYFGYHKKVLPKWLLVAWNIGGIVLLVNIVTIAILSMPTSFQVFTNLPHNTIVFYAPFNFIPFFFVPLALFGHLFALKRLFKK